jgi:hypothetical protein
MDKEKELNQTQVIVKDILMNYPIARDSDMYLYLRVVKRLNPAAVNKPFSEVVLNLEELGLPCFETVRRTRQKLQAEFLNLRGSDRIRSLRSINEEVFKEFARS